MSLAFMPQLIPVDNDDILGIMVLFVCLFLGVHLIFTRVHNYNDNPKTDDPDIGKFQTRITDFFMPIRIWDDANE